MVEKKFKVSEINELMMRLRGAVRQVGNAQIPLFAGLCNEKEISEGVRRIANKLAKKLESNYPKDILEKIQLLSPWDLLTEEEQKEYKDPKDFKPTEDQVDKAKKEKELKFKEIFDDTVTINFDELLNWETLHHNLEGKNKNLSHNYDYLFERLAENY